MSRMRRWLTSWGADMDADMHAVTAAAEEYREPSIADGTVSPGLIEGLRRLTDEYGLSGVRSTLDEMFGPAEYPAQD